MPQVSPRNPYPAMIGSEVWKAWYKAILLFPISLNYVCRFVLPVIEDFSCLSLRTPPVNLLQKYSHFMRKRKKLPGMWMWQMKNSIVVVCLVLTFFTVRLDVYKTVTCNESICANLWETLSESQCKNTTFLFPNSPMLTVAHRYSSIITDRVMLHKYDT